jgi:nucleotide-binding universal stress UspA family protein
VNRRTETPTRPRWSRSRPNPVRGGFWTYRPERVERVDEYVRDTCSESGTVMRLEYRRDVAGAIVDAADEVGASAIVFRPRGGSRVVQFPSGNVVDDEAAGRAFLRDWADQQGLDDVELRVESDDVEAAIERAAADHTTAVIGATERGLLSRLVRGSLDYEVLDEIETPVILTQKARERGFVERLLGRWPDPLHVGGRGDGRPETGVI